MKSQWQKINLGVQKFKGHYKQTVELRKNNCLENNVMLDAYAIWKQDKHSDFTLEHAWRLLKDKPKMVETMHKKLFKKNKAFYF